MLPLIRIHAVLQDHLILVLRKSIFAREEHSRLNAVHGFLMLLQSFQDPEQEEEEEEEGGKQGKQEVEPAKKKKKNEVVHVDIEKQETLFSDILNALKRCLGQQSSVRQSTNSSGSD